MSIKKAVGLGGAVSGEHGIGFLKSKYIPLQYSESEIAAMKKIKTALDPKNILNPGKIYEPRDISNLEPLRGIRLPWD